MLIFTFNHFLIICLNVHGLHFLLPVLYYTYAVKKNGSVVLFHSLELLDFKRIISFSQESRIDCSLQFFLLYYLEHIDDNCLQVNYLLLWQNTWAKQLNTVKVLFYLMVLETFDPCWLGSTFRRSMVEVYDKADMLTSRQSRRGRMERKGQDKLLLLKIYSIQLHMFLSYNSLSN